MPHNKNQHFVPKCHLRPFSEYGGEAVNLFNIVSKKSIATAPIKGQCARSYFYGKDLALEKIFQGHEGKYSLIVRKIISLSKLDKEDLIFMKDFMLLQYFRTEAAVVRARLAIEGYSREIWRDEVDAANAIGKVDHLDIVALAMKSFLETSRYTSDLKICIIENRSKIDLITSDDPAIMTNKYYQLRVAGRSFGVTNTGLIFIMPVSPRFAIMAYDGGAYSIFDKSGDMVAMRKDADAASLNYLQYVKCFKNIYFSKWDDELVISANFSQAEPKRINKWHAFNTFVLDSENDYEQRFRSARNGESRNERKELVVLSSKHIFPEQWLSMLKFRSVIRSFQNGTGVGHVRKKEWLTS